MKCYPDRAEEIPDETPRCTGGGFPTWATVLLSALGGAAIAVVGTALLQRASAPAPPAPVEPPAPPAQVEPPVPPAPKRPRRSRRRAPAP